jgi:hypothetical protein
VLAWELSLAPGLGSTSHVHHVEGEVHVLEVPHALTIIGSHDGEPLVHPYIACDRLSNSPKCSSTMRLSGSMSVSMSVSLAVVVEVATVRGALYTLTGRSRLRTVLGGFPASSLAVTVDDLYKGVVTNGIVLKVEAET